MHSADFQPTIFVDLIVPTVNWEIFVVKIFLYGLLPYEN